MLSSYTKYVIVTLAFGAFGLLGLGYGVYFLMTKKYFLFVIGILIFLVAMDNFFCSARLKKCGITIPSHYAAPPFLRMR